MKPVRVKTHARRQRESQRGVYRRAVEAGECQFEEATSRVKGVETMSLNEFSEKYGTTPLKQQRIQALSEYLNDFMPFHLGVKPVEVVVYGSFLIKEYPADLDVIIHSHQEVSPNLRGGKELFHRSPEESYWNIDRGLDVVHISDHGGYCAYLTFAGQRDETRQHETGKLVRIVL